MVWTTDAQGNYSSTITDDDAGNGMLIVEGLPWGKYQLSELESKDGFKLSTEVYKFEIGPDNQNGTVKINPDKTFENESFSITFNKYETGTTNGLDGGTFVLKDSANTELGRYEAEDGVITIHSIKDTSTETPLPSTSAVMPTAKFSMVSRI